MSDNGFKPILSLKKKKWGKKGTAKEWHSVILSEKEILKFAKKNDLELNDKEIQDIAKHFIDLVESDIEESTEKYLEASFKEQGYRIK
ncbi:MAG: hypothetical protein ACFFDB_00460 [Promethearchaeota archaeon]